MTSIAFEAAVSGIIGAIDRTSKAEPAIAKAANNAVKGIFSKETWQDAIESVVENVGKVANKGLEEAANLGISNTLGKGKGKEEQPVSSLSDPENSQPNNTDLPPDSSGNDNGDNDPHGTEPGGAIRL